MKKILCVCLSSTLQRTIDFENLSLENVNRAKGYVLDASGKAVNSARVLNQLTSGCVKVVCPVGKIDAKQFTVLAKKDGLTIKTVKIPGRIRECWTLLDRVNRTTTELVVGEPGWPDFDYSKTEKKLLKIISKECKKCDAVLLAGSRPGYFNKDLCAQIARNIALEGKVFMADYWGADLIKTLEVCTPEIIKINETEFIQTFENPSFLSEDFSSEQWKTESLEKKISYVSEKLGNTVVVTRGKNSTLASKCGFMYECPVQKAEVINTTACGDSFSAGFIKEFLESDSVKKALEKGTECAAKNAMRVRPGDIL